MVKFKVRKSKNMHQIIGILLFLFSIGFINTINAEVIKKEVKFKKGTSSTVINDVVKNGDKVSYELIANAGQTLTVSIISKDGNAVFGLYIDTPYGYQDIQDEEGKVSFKDAEKYNPEADNEKKVKGIDEDRTTWSGKLYDGSKQGSNSIYEIIVKTKSGDSNYTLNISIK
jgi:hypothetical protein